MPTASRLPAMMPRHSRVAMVRPMNRRIGCFAFSFGSFGAFPGFPGSPTGCSRAALAHIYLTSRRRLRRTAFAAPVDLSHLIAGDRDRLLTHTGKLQRTRRCDLPFKKPLVTQHTIPYYSTPAGRGQGPIFCRGADVPFNHGQYTTSGPAKYSILPQKMIFRRTSGPYFR